MNEPSIPHINFTQIRHLDKDPQFCRGDERSEMVSRYFPLSIHLWVSSI